MLGVKMVCANLEAANLKGSNFEDPAGSRANLEGVNLKGANLEGSIMAGRKAYILHTQCTVYTVYTRHVQKTPFFMDPHARLTKGGLLVPRTLVCL